MFVLRAASTYGARNLMSVQLIDLGTEYKLSFFKGLKPSVYCITDHLDIAIDHFEYLVRYYNLEEDRNN